MFNCTQKGAAKNLATLQKKMFRSNVAFLSFLSISIVEVSLEVTRNLNDMFLEVMFSIAKQNNKAKIAQ
jgi:hypothetical protein